MARVCQYCGKEGIKQGRGTTCHECAILYKQGLNRNYQRIKKEKPKHTLEELEAIKEKYKNGVPAGEIENWIKGL